MSSPWNLYTISHGGRWAIDNVSYTDYQSALNHACDIIDRNYPHLMMSVLIIEGILTTPFNDAILVMNVRDDSQILIVDNVHVCNDSSLCIKCKEEEQLQYYKYAMCLSPGLIIGLELEGFVEFIGPYGDPRCPRRGAPGTDAVDAA
jgi:hypothetical protein